MDSIYNVVTNDLFLSLILSPLMGVLFGYLFSGSKSEKINNIPVSIYEIKNIYKTKIVISNDVKKDNGNLSILFFIVIILLLGVWKYSIYSNQILLILKNYTLALISFSTTIIIISSIRSYFTTYSWLLNSLIPLMLTIFCYYIIYKADYYLEPQIKDIAENTDYLDFFSKKLTPFGRCYMISHIMGLLIVSFSLMVLSTYKIFYHLLLKINFTNSNSKILLFILKLTQFFSGIRWLIFTFFLLVFSFLCVTPQFFSSWIYQ